MRVTISVLPFAKKNSDMDVHWWKLFCGEVNTTERKKQCNLHEKVSSGKNRKKRYKFYIRTQFKCVE